MEIQRNLPTGSHGNIIRQLDIERTHQTFAGDAALGVKAHTELVGMNAAVGSGAALDVVADSQHRLHGILKGLGDGDGIFLHLKAVVVGSLIADGKKKIS